MKRKLNIHGLNKILYTFTFNQIRSYLLNTQELLKKMESDLINKINKWDPENKSDDMVEAYDVYENEIQEIREFPSLINKSIFLASYAQFEVEMNKICERCQYEDELKIGPKDLAGGNIIGQCHKFITKVLQLDLRKLNTHWQKIRTYQKIRNAFAHNNSILKDTQSGVLNEIKQIHGLSVDNSTYEIQVISNEFMMKFIDIAIKFLDGVVEEIINRNHKDHA